VENTSVLVDTSVLIDYFRKKNKLGTAFLKISQTYNLAVSSITEFEFLVGTKEEHQEFIETLFNSLGVLPFDSRCAKKAREIYRDLRTKNRLIELSDILIASTALANDLPLATLNTKHFSRIESLNIVDLPS
jgi:tRNA(fMet)-specific endonuclease VapC